MLAGSLLLYLWVGPALIGLDAAHLAMWLTRFPFAHRGRYHLSSSALGALGRHRHDGVLQPGGASAPMADDRALLQRPSTRPQSPGSVDLDQRMAAIEVPLAGWWRPGSDHPRLLAIQYFAFHISIWLD